MKKELSALILIQMLFSIKGHGQARKTCCFPAQQSFLRNFLKFKNLTEHCPVSLVCACECITPPAVCSMCIIKFIHSLIHTHPQTAITHQSPLIHPESPSVTPSSHHIHPAVTLDSYCSCCRPALRFSHANAMLKQLKLLPSFQAGYALV